MQQFQVEDIAGQAFHAFPIILNLLAVKRVDGIALYI